jgi:uncharacterized protein YqfA (UPF0365 family)
MLSYNLTILPFLSSFFFLLSSTLLLYVRLVSIIIVLSIILLIYYFMLYTNLKIGKYSTTIKVSYYNDITMHTRRPF